MDKEEHALENLHRGQHVRAWRKCGAFEHHGIVIAESDLKRIEPSIWPDKTEPILVAEQNLKGLRIVTVKEFRTDNFFTTIEYKLNVVQYSTTSEKVILSVIICHLR